MSSCGLQCMAHCVPGALQIAGSHKRLLALGGCAMVQQLQWTHLHQQWICYTMGSRADLTSPGICCCMIKLSPFPASSAAKAMLKSRNLWVCMPSPGPRLQVKQKLSLLGTSDLQMAWFVTARPPAQPERSSHVPTCCSQSHVCDHDVHVRYCVCTQPGGLSMSDVSHLQAGLLLSSTASWIFKTFHL